MKHINRTMILAAGVMLAGLSHFVGAEEALTSDQVKALFTDKTFDAENLVKGRKHRIYSSAGGTMELASSKGNIKTRYWLVDDEGRHCVSRKKGEKGRCSVVIDMGGGVYKKITDGEHTHTLKGFADGDQL